MRGHKSGVSCSRAADASRELWSCIKQRSARAMGVTCLDVHVGATGKAVLAADDSSLLSLWTASAAAYL